MLLLIAIVATVAIVVALIVVAIRRHRYRLDSVEPRVALLEPRVTSLEADHAAVPTEVRAIRAGAIASDIDERRKLHELRIRVVGIEESQAQLNYRLRQLESPGVDLDPIDTIRGPRPPIDPPK